VLAASALAFRSPLHAHSTQVGTHLEVLPADPIGVIALEIYSHFIEQFAEHSRMVSTATLI
jgi:hypothetical protein